MYQGEIYYKCPQMNYKNVILAFKKSMIFAKFKTLWRPF